MTVRQKEARRRYLNKWRHQNPQRVRQHYEHQAHWPTEGEIRAAGWIDFDRDGGRWLNPDHEKFPGEGWHAWVERTGYPWRWTPWAERPETLAEREYRRVLRLYLASSFPDLAVDKATAAAQAIFPGCFGDV